MGDRKQPRQRPENQVKPMPPPAPPAKRGRPRQFDGTVSIRLSEEMHDLLSLIALRQDRDISDVIRAQIELLDKQFVSQKSTRSASAVS